MNTIHILPNEDIASTVVASMTNEEVVSSNRMTTGDQYFVFEVKTKHSEYVIRMTDVKYRKNFLSAIYWQEKLLPLGVPLAKFIKSDLDGKYSEFPSLLMTRFPGDDLINVYANLKESDKKNLAHEMVKIQAMTAALPAGVRYGITERYEHLPDDETWYDFLVNKLCLFRELIAQAGIFDSNQVADVLSITKIMKKQLCKITARPFLWDASERNVIVDQGKISGIVDVDDMCFGDPLFVLGLTYTAFEAEGYDTLYCDYWAEELNLNKNAEQCLQFYRLFYVIQFMRKHSMLTMNMKKAAFDVNQLQHIFKEALSRMK
jgi:hypothetical protein